MGTKIQVCDSCEYFDVFLSAAASAAPPDVIDVDDRYDCVNMSVTVTSHVTHLPFFHWISGTTSGRFPSDLERPDSSSAEGMLTGGSLQAFF